MKRLISLLVLATGLAAHAQVQLGGHVYVPSSTDSSLGQANVVFTADANCTLTSQTNCTVTATTSGTSDAPYLGTLKVTSSVSLTGTRNVILPLSPGRTYNVENATTGGQSIILIGTSGTGVTITNGTSAAVFTDGTNYFGAGGGSGGNTSNPTICTANTTGNKCLGVSPYLAVSGDWTTALRQAVSDLCTDGGGTLWVPPSTSTYNANGSTTGVSNSVVPLCGIAETGAPFISIAIRGLVPVGGVSQTLQPMLETTTNSGAFFGDYNASGPFGGFTTTRLTIKDMRLRGPGNPTINMVDASHMAALEIDDSWTDTATGATPTTGTGAGVIFPAIANDVSLSSNNYSSVGFAEGLITGEHATITNPHCGAEITCVVLNGGGLSGYPHQANSVIVIHPWAQGPVVNLLGAGPTYPTTVSVFNADAETMTHVLNDPSNLIQGYISYSVPYDGGSVTYCNPNNVGGTNPALTLVNLQCPATAMQGSSINWYPNNPLTYGSSPEISLTHATSDLNRLNLNSRLFVESSSYNGVVDFGAENGNNSANSYAQVYAAGAGSIAGNKYVRMIAFDSNASFGTPFTPLSGYFGAGPAMTGGLMLNTEGAAPIKLDTNGTLAVTVDSSQNATFVGSVQTPLIHIAPVSTTNGTIDFGANFGTDAIDLYHAGTTKWGWGLTSGEMQFFSPDLFSHFSFNAAAGGLQASGTNEFARLSPRTAGGSLTLSSGMGHCFSNSTTSAVTADTCMWRDSAGVVDLGNGTAGNKSGTLNLASVRATGASQLAATDFVGNATMDTQGTATSGTNFNSYILELTGSYWNGSAGTIAQWGVQVQTGTGTNPASILALIPPSGGVATAVGINSQVGPASAPTGSCSIAGAYVLSQDGSITICNGSTWVALLTHSLYVLGTTPPSLAAGACSTAGLSAVPFAGSHSAYSANFVGPSGDLPQGITITVGFKTDVSQPQMTLCNTTSSAWTNPGDLDVSVGAF